MRRYCTTCSRWKRLAKHLIAMALVRGVLNKLPGIKAELVQGKPNWQSWDFTELTSALRGWKEIHPRESVRSREAPRTASTPGQRSFHVQEHSTNTYTLRGCVYCNDASHKSSECTVISSPAERRKFLQGKRLCFNCTGPHRAAHCRSRTVRTASRGTTPRSAIGKFRLQRPMEQH